VCNHINQDATKALAEDGGALHCQKMIDAMAAKAYWTSPGGKSPAALSFSTCSRCSLSVR
jgi:hypothetical protein